MTCSLLVPQRYTKDGASGQ